MSKYLMDRLEKLAGGNYDLKLDVSHIYKSLDTPDPIRRYLIYREMNKPKVVFDCDKGKLARELYEVLYGWTPKGGSSKLKSIFGDGVLFTPETYNTPSNLLAYITRNKILPSRELALKMPSVRELIEKYHSVGNIGLIFKFVRAGEVRTFNMMRGHSGLGKDLFAYDELDMTLYLIKKNLGKEAFRLFVDTFGFNVALDDGYVIVDSSYDIVPFLDRNTDCLNDMHHTCDVNEVMPRTLGELEQNIERKIATIKAREKWTLDKLKRFYLLD